jgi:hypothetical protein
LRDIAVPVENRPRFADLFPRFFAKNARNMAIFLRIFARTTKKSPANPSLFSSGTAIQKRSGRALPQASE